MSRAFVASLSLERIDQLLRGSLPADLRPRTIERLREAIPPFDTDKNGMLTGNERIDMLRILKGRTK